MSTTVHNSVKSSSGLKAQVDQLIAHIKEGRIIDAMEKFYCAQRRDE